MFYSLFCDYDQTNGTYEYNGEDMLCAHSPIGIVVSSNGDDLRIINNFDELNKELEMGSVKYLEIYPRNNVYYPDTLNLKHVNTIIFIYEDIVPLFIQNSKINIQLVCKKMPNFTSPYVSKVEYMGENKTNINISNELQTLFPNTKTHFIWIHVASGIITS